MGGGAGGRGVKRRERAGEPGTAAKMAKVQKKWVTNMLELYRKSNPDPWARVLGRG